MPVGVCIAGGLDGTTTGVAGASGAEAVGMAIGTPDGRKEAVFFATGDVIGGLETTGSFVKTPARNEPNWAML